jgi:DNA-damage-inducible protein J
MEKTATLNLRVDPVVKKNAENVLGQLGIPMSTAIDMYLYQISLTGGIPFAISLPKAPADVNADSMTASELNEKLEKGYADLESGNVQDAEAAFRAFREKH